jgi:iron complex outermembrane receptor protein
VPEDITNYEAGFKGTLWNGLVSFDGAYFHMTRDGIVVETREGPFFRNSNAGVQKFKGSEFSVSWRPYQVLNIYANAAFYKNRFGRFVIQTAGGDTVLTGNRLPVSPDQIINAGATWSEPTGFGSSINVKHVGDRFLDQLNTFLLHSYTTVDASAFWEKGPMRFTIAGHNLTNKTYFNMGDLSVAESVDPAPPRQFVAFASYRFIDHR